MRGFHPFDIVVFRHFQNFTCKAVFRILNRTDPHKEMPPGSRSAWTDADPDPGDKKPRKCTGSLGEYRTGRIKVRIIL